MKLVHFRETGDTTYPVGETFRYNVGYIKILSALDNTDLRNSTYSVLCISNFWDEARMEEWKKKNSFVYSNLERFDTILCNRRVTESTNINL